MPKLAIFGPSEPEALMQKNCENRYYRALFAELRCLGRVVGTNLSVARHGRERSSPGAKAVPPEVVACRPDCIYVVGPDALLFKEATDSIPIVALTGDPMRQGLTLSATMKMKLNAGPNNWRMDTPKSCGKRRAG